MTADASGRPMTFLLFPPPTDSPPESPVANLWARCEPGQQEATQAVGCVQYGSDEQTTGKERQGPPWCGSYQAEAETHWVGRINQPSALPLTWTRPAKEALPF